MKSDRLANALREDTSILSSAIMWLDGEMDRIHTNAVQRQTDHDEWLQLKGEARLIWRLQDELRKLAKVKDGTQDQSRNGKDGRGVSRGL